MSVVPADLLYLFQKGKHFPGVRVLFFLITLLLWSVVCPMMSFMFLFFLYPYTGRLLNTVLNLLDQDSLITNLTVQFAI